MTAAACRGSRAGLDRAEEAEPRPDDLSLLEGRGKTLNPARTHEQKLPPPSLEGAPQSVPSTPWPAATRCCPWHAPHSKEPDRSPRSLECRRRDRSASPRPRSLRAVGDGRPRPWQRLGGESAQNRLPRGRHRRRYGLPMPFPRYRLLNSLALTVDRDPVVLLLETHLSVKRVWVRNRNTSRSKGAVQLADRPERRTGRRTQLSFRRLVPHHGRRSSHPGHGPYLVPSDKNPTTTITFSSPSRAAVWGPRSR